MGEGGDYLWLVKANQKGLLEEIAQLFEPLEWGPGFSAPALAVRSYSQYQPGYGRLERRSIWVSSELADYSYWPRLAQVFKLEREWQAGSDPELKREVRYGVTSLSAKVAGPQRLLEIAREEWGIENSVHWVRDVTFREDASHLRHGKAPQVLAALNNAVLNLLRYHQVTNIAKARREWGYTFISSLFEASLTLQ